MLQKVCRKLYRFVFRGGMLFLALFLTACSSAKSQVLIDYQRSGGLAGLNDHLVVEADGSAVLSRKTGKTEFKLDGKTIRYLTELFDQQGFRELGRTYLPDKGADLIEYQVKYQGHQVRTADTAVPTKLVPILDELNRIIVEKGEVK